MALFLAVFDLELKPMIAFVGWRRAGARSGEAAAAAVVAAPLDAFIRVKDAETVLVLEIPFAAALKARGAWLF